MRPIAIIGLLLLLLTGCEQYIEQSECAELTFNIVTSSLGTRGNVSDYPNIPSEWTQEERAVDGRYMYALSVYILNNNNQIVASQEDITLSAETTETVVTFDKSYNLKRGVYTVMAVANHTDHTIGNKIYNSGVNNNWDSGDYQSLMNNTISGNTTHNVSSKDVIQPLSMMKSIELHAGNNIIEGELVRTFARIRIEVKNNSGTLPLSINSLSFSNNFTQKQAYVFDDGSDRKYFGNTGAPVATSPYALHPFTYDTLGSVKTIEARTSAVVFDSYLLESKLNDGDYYKYTLDISYEGTSATYSFEPNWTAINQVNKMNVGEESYFLLYNNNRKRYLSAETNKVGTATLSTSSSSVATDHVWQLISAGTNKYYLLNVETGLYMQNPSSNEITLGKNPVAFTFATKTSGSSRYITMAGSNGSYVYVGNSNAKYAVTGYSSGSNSGVYFTLYNVNKNRTSLEAGSISYNTPIILTTINPVTQQSSPTRAIKRNDFINVLVTVSYNDVAGKFEFYVQDWAEGGGSVEFD